MSIVRAKVGLTSASEDTKIRIIWIYIQQFMKRSVIANALCGCSINEVHYSKKSLVPIFQWHGCSS
jgi:hypothetical protein